MDRPVTGTEAVLIVTNGFNCNGPPFGFNCRVSRGAPKRRPKYRTPARVTQDPIFSDVLASKEHPVLKTLRIANHYGDSLGVLIRPEGPYWEESEPL